MTIPSAPELPAADLLPASQVQLLDVVVELPRNHPIVVLRELDPPRRVLRFPVGTAEGVAIAYARRGEATPRPLTHELLADIMRRFGVTLELVRITRVVGRTLHAELVLHGNGRSQSVACRPSDAIALALRQTRSVPIMVAESVLAWASDPLGVGPAPVGPSADPDPVEPDRVEPGPVDPEPVEPQPVDPEPVDPEPVEPQPVDPEPVEPQPVEPQPVDPEPVDPVDSDPAPSVRPVEGPA